MTSGQSPSRPAAARFGSDGSIRNARVCCEVYAGGPVEATYRLPVIPDLSRREPFKPTITLTGPINLAVAKDASNQLAKLGYTRDRSDPVITRTQVLNSCAHTSDHVGQQSKAPASTPSQEEHPRIIREMQLEAEQEMISLFA